MPAILEPDAAAIDPAVLERPVEGAAIPVGSTLRDVLGRSAPQPTLLVFLRHYG